MHYTGCTGSLAFKGQYKRVARDKYVFARASRVLLVANLKFYTSILRDIYPSDLRDTLVEAMAGSAKGRSSAAVRAVDTFRLGEPGWPAAHASGQHHRRGARLAAGTGRRCLS